MTSRQYLPRKVPEKLQGLVALALDLRWSWYHGYDTFWRKVDAELWHASANPWLILESVSDSRLRELADDQPFLAELNRILSHRHEHFNRPTWFSRLSDHDLNGSVAYFSMEFGICESLPIYAGGLGVLAGDLLKTACDLGVPVTGVGLLYQLGYFRQKLDNNGQQLEFYPYNDPTMLPVVPLRDDDGEWLRVSLQLPGRRLLLRSWLAKVGRCSLFLLDSNDPANDPGDRGITSELYGGGAEVRLQQEMVLGIGGWRLLDKLDSDYPVCHLNEGHAAFAVLERARLYMRRHRCDFETARCATRIGNLFTSHTPVSAAFDAFPAELIRLYFGQYAAELDIGIDDLLALGRSGAGDAGEPFNMAWLAVRGAGAVNGVSRLHGEVSRQIYQPLFPRWPAAEVPVSHVTNGVHMPSWDSPAADELWTRACGKRRWSGNLDTIEEKLSCVSDEDLWQLRCEGRRHMLDFVSTCLEKQWRSHADPNQAEALPVKTLNPEVLTLGLARRFTGYKRPDLLLWDSERLSRLLASRDRPVQLVIGGKAHPQDRLGKAMLRRWFDFIHRPELDGRVVFVEDYNLVMAAELVHGIDVWINTPCVRYEACGTSGMKVLVNGGLNLSIRDGWWAEAFTPGVGWAIGERSPGDAGACSDADDAEQLYRLLENDIVPMFYRRNRQGIPVEWVQLIRESMSRLTRQYSSNRMLREYTERYYLPLAAALRKRGARKSALRRKQQVVTAYWQDIHFGAISCRTQNDKHHFEIQVYLNELPGNLVKVEIYAEADETASLPPRRQRLRRGRSLVGTRNAHSYRGSVLADRPLSAFTARVLPNIEGLQLPLELNLILWHH